jgi:hypothetical protein
MILHQIKVVPAARYVLSNFLAEVHVEFTSETQTFSGINPTGGSFPLGWHPQRSQGFSASNYCGFNIAHLHGIVNIILECFL